MGAPTARVIHGDCIEVMREMPENSIDSIVTDPPYGMGFMGKKWDDLPPGKEWAEQCLRVLKPGGHLLSFGGTRTWHRLAVVVEDAGFEIRDSIAWLYGTGFPKNKAALKPAFEPVVMARKPFSGSTVWNVQEWGTGALGIDGSRVGKGARWPSNVILDESQSTVLDKQSGYTKSGGRTAKAGDQRGGSWRVLEGRAGQHMRASDCDVSPSEGGASRFFYVAKAPKRERPVVDGIAHPTVKPLTLMRYLVKLVTPPCGTVLEPFAGSGATVEACILEGFDCLAIERELEYIPLIEARIERTEAA